MKFHIEIVRDDGEVMYRVSVDEMSQKRAKGRVAALLGYYKSRGAIEARVSNDKGEELYRL